MLALPSQAEQELAALGGGDPAQVTELEALIETHRSAKEEGNRRLQDVSDEHKAMMVALREQME